MSDDRNYETLQRIDQSQVEMAKQVAVLLDRSKTQIKHNEQMAAKWTDNDQHGCPQSQSNKKWLTSVDEKVEKVITDVAISQGMSKRQVGTLVGGSSTVVGILTWCATKASEWWNG